MHGKRVAAAEQHAERAVEHQQRANDILLVPAPVLVEHPLLRIVRRQKDVVEMDAHALPQTRQHFEAQMIHVAAGLCHVRRVQEQHVTGVELRKNANINVLDLLHEQTRDAQLPRLEKGTRVGFDAGDAHCATEKSAVDVGDQQRRETRAYFDEPLRPPGAEQDEQRAAVEPAELVVVEVEAQRIAVGLFRIREVRIEGRKIFAQHPLVMRVVEIDAENRGPRRPDQRLPSAQLVDVDDRRIEVARRKKRLLRRRCLEEIAEHPSQSAHRSLSRPAEAMRHRLRKTTSHTPCPRLMPRRSNLVSGRYAGRGA